MFWSTLVIHRNLPAFAQAGSDFTLWGIQNLSNDVRHQHYCSLDAAIVFPNSVYRLCHSLYVRKVNSDLQFSLCTFIFFSGLVKVSWFQKADWRAVDFPKKQTDQFVLFAVKSKKANKSNLSVRFLGEVSRP